MNDKITIIIATHKEYNMPKDDMYLPLHVGAEGKDIDFGYAKDNTGDNISSLNGSFCELTGLYWAWKNLTSDYIGLVHYRRHFSVDRSSKAILGYNDIAPMLGSVKLFIPTKRWYVIETLYSHYAHTHYAIQLDATEKILKEKHPEFLSNYNRIIHRRYGYMFNMLVAERTLLDEYCSWLFPILFQLKDEIDMPDLGAYQGRYFGRVAEILFNVWIDYKIESGQLARSEVKELKCVHMEKINWYKKGGAFLRAKFFKKKYTGSF